MLTKVTVLLAIILTAFTAVALSHSLQEDKEYSAIRTKQALKIDGWLNEPIWKQAPTATGFIQDYPERGKAPTESTFVKIVYDDEALYVAFICFDSEPDKIVRRLAKRDRSGNADFIRIEIDSYHDHRTGYLFQINTADIQLDGYRYNDGWRDDSWDAVWDGRARITDFGYTAELKIPYSCLRFNNHRIEHNWGINFIRYIPRKNEVLVWSYVPPDNQGWNSRFGHLTGIRGIEPRTHLELMPYAVTSGESEPKSLGNPDDRDYTGDLGVDFKYGLTSNLTLDATINPDFGQVEADPAVLNLSTFETWYPEKRPFFIEGDKYFDTKFTLFYSRRIGQRPGDWPDDVDYYVRKPKNTTILGAGKITGRTDNGWVIGFLNSVTREEEATYVNEDGQRLKSTVEQPANWNVTRIKKEFDNGSSLGVIGTAVHQKKHTPVYAGGLDWDLKFADRRYRFDGQVVGSKYDEEGTAALAAFRRESGKHFRWAFGGEYESEDFNINRIGFIGRSDYAGGWGWWQYRNQDSWWIFRDMYHNLNYWQSHNLDGDKINIGANYNASYSVKGNWNFWYGFEIEPEHYDDRETRDGPLYWNPESHASWYGAETDFPGWINYGASLTWGSDRDGRILSSSVWTTLNFSDRLKIVLNPSYSMTKKQSRWITDDEDADGNRVDIFGELDTEKFEIEMRTTYMFSRDMSLDVYAQMFFASGKYDGFKELRTPKTFGPLTVAYDDNPDFLSKAFNLNMVYRWDYIPGSTLYVVFTQARDDSRDDYNRLKFGRDADDLFRLPSNNVFLVKISYWWNPSIG